MNDGTQDLLYISICLRMIGGSVTPLLVDDALINFDDHRACGALHLISSATPYTKQHNYGSDFNTFTFWTHSILLIGTPLDDREMVQRHFRRYVIRLF